MALPGAAPLTPMRAKGRRYPMRSMVGDPPSCSRAAYRSRPGGRLAAMAVS